MTSPSQIDAIKELSPEKLDGYLSYNGWVSDGVLNKVAQIWHREEDGFEDLEIIQPLSKDIKDYVRRVYDLIDVLEDYENRPRAEIVNDINNFLADVIKIRVLHEDVKEGSIPLNDGVLLFEKAKELIVSAVKSTFNKRKYFGGGKMADDVADLINSIRLGQTEHSSYVVNMIAPILKEEEQQEKIIKTSITRVFTQNLSRSLKAIENSIDEYKETQNLSSFDSAVERGVSANLCDALIGISGEHGNRNIKVSVRLSGYEEDLSDIDLDHSFDTSDIPYLKIASEYYRENYVLRNQVVTGLVTRLSHEEFEEVGEIFISASVNGEEKNVKIELPIENYWQAHSAHKKLQTVSCQGDLHVSPRMAKLLDVRNFQVIDNDLFDND